MAQARVVIGKKRSGRDAWLYENAALSYFRMLADGMPAGGITDAGRTYAEQQALWNAYLRGELVATAARPGTSKHESGRAMDLSGEARAWVRANGAKYGWMRDRVRNEPWHFEYEWANDSQIGRGDPRQTTAGKVPHMVIIQYGSRYRVISGDRLAGIGADDIPAFRAAGIPVVAVGKETWDNFRAGFTPEG